MGPTTDPVFADSFRALARDISAVENETPGYEAVLEAMRPDDGVPVIGITGPPGAGKSTLIDAMLAALLAGKGMPLNGKGVGVISVDPSSPFSSGALLGDRLRMGRHFNDPRVFIRSLASRGSLGGLSYKTMEVADLMRSRGFGLVLVETVGVGQSEMEIAALADVTVLVLVPESGDDVQVVKAGVMEVADVYVINKADRAGADRLEAFIREAAALDPVHPLHDTVIRTVATEGKGVADLLDAVFRAHAGRTEGQKEDLLFEKTLRLIRDYRMKQVDRDALRQALRQRDKAAFNAYAFARRVAQGNA